ncbi:shikimate dehydrogenase family protein [Loktanella sp. S4079]|uniref:shikimate dehydrogenase family protein n=1 Tax=Loktanella sp. S4079 TaxID=579483 RepID=UPI0005FA33E3|nr:shikimate dehydrogenase [Loktanella sp. S4079]KJZ18512.1 shikimate dehydrogenase [Loktanella sp. S4079]
MTLSPDLKLGLIGDNIAGSRSPQLHQLAGGQRGITVQYDRLVPKDLGQDFDHIFKRCPDHGYRGVNVTYPYKTRAAQQVTITDPLVRAIGAVNTVLFDQDGPKGMNTDYSGFIAAYKSARGELAPGVTCLIGTGGVGRALAFGLVALGAQEIRLVDTEPQKAETLAAELRAVIGERTVKVFDNAAQAAKGAHGLLNGSPVGMDGIGGTPLAKQAMTQAQWAFDAVYTPVNTQFLQDARMLGLKTISGYELFIYQGIHAWTHFSGQPIDEEKLRADLITHGEAA